jgi:hypothetical protein
MTSATFADIEAYHRSGGRFDMEEVPDGLVFTWHGGDLVMMTMELVAEFERRRMWERMPWVFERLGVVPGMGAILYRKLGERAY